MFPHKIYKKTNSTYPANHKYIFVRIMFAEGPPYHKLGFVVAPRVVQCLPPLPSVAASPPGASPPGALQSVAAAFPPQVVFGEGTARIKLFPMMFVIALGFLGLLRVLVSRTTGPGFPYYGSWFPVLRRICSVLHRVGVVRLATLTRFRQHPLTVLSRTGPYYRKLWAHDAPGTLNHKK